MHPRRSSSVKARRGRSFVAISYCAIVEQRFLAPFQNNTTDNTHVRYRALSAKLVQAGLASPGHDGDTHQTTRSQYRQGLDLLADSVTSASANSNLRPTTQRLLTATDAPTIDLPQELQQLQLSQQLPAIPAAFGHLVSPPLVAFTSQATGVGTNARCASLRAFIGAC